MIRGLTMHALSYNACIMDKPKYRDAKFIPATCDIWIPSAEKWHSLNTEKTHYSDAACECIDNNTETQKVYTNILASKTKNALYLYLENVSHQWRNTYNYSTVYFGFIVKPSSADWPNHLIAGWSCCCWWQFSHVSRIVNHLKRTLIKRCVL
jgi:hypothetical protein